ncbi:MAG: heme NO-binding domain-containing protein [Vulcanimicrobiota bacterium]
MKARCPLKGVIFTEFLGLVEQIGGFELGDGVITAAGLDGAYTALGNYPYEELVALVEQLSLRLGQPVAVLLEQFGRHLFGRFLQLYPDLFRDHRDAFALLARLDDTIHVEVRKLYPEATPPRFECRLDGDSMELVYTSVRPFADLARGLLNACLEGYGEGIEVHEQDARGDRRQVRFDLRRQELVRVTPA